MSLIMPGLFSCTRTRRRIAVIGGCATALAILLGLSALKASAGKPAFDGKSLAGWHPLGGEWRAEKGEIAGAPRPTPGWLVLDRSYQDLGLSLSFRCTGGCQTGVLIGMEKSGDRTTGIFVSLADDDLSGYEMTLDAQGQEIERHKPTAAAPGRGAGARGGSGGGAGRGGGRRGPAPPAGHPLGAPATPASLKADGWNQLEVRQFSGIRATASSLQVVLNGVIVATGFPSGANGPAPGRGDSIGGQPELGRFGPLALRVAGSPGAEVRFKDVAITDYTEIDPPVEKLSKGFRMIQPSPFFYGDGTCIGDLNHDGLPDIVAGPMYWIGPDFKKGREIDMAQPMDIKEYTRVMGCEVADFTGDGWDDVVETGYPGNGPMYLYVNPHNEARRWPRYKVLDAVSEIYAVADIDGDGKPELVYGGGNYPGNYAKPDPVDPTKPWIEHHIGEQANWGNHGLGVGDINGDGRPDVVRAWGWWEHPANPDAPWPFHPAVLGRNGPAAGPGGAQMFVYDVNGDGLPDVITSLEAHGYGFAWYEQKRSPQGEISFVEHVIMDKDPAQSHGVFFTELHGLALGDIDGDGLKDIVTGKNKYNWGGHYDYTYPDEDGEGVLYWFKLVRGRNGQADFVPHLIYNNSGVGRQPRIVDLNGDGVMDIANSGRMGTFIFFGKKGVKDWAAVPR